MPSQTYPLSNCRTEQSLPTKEVTVINETDPFWMGQAKINGKLCRVDWLILEALREARRLLKAEGADVTRLKAMIAQADELSEEVALENPPGCNPTDRSGGLGEPGGAYGA